MKTEYLCMNIKGVPPLKRIGHNTRKGKPKNHVYKSIINDNVYYIVRLNRSNKQLTKYFKTRKEAKEFVQLLASKRVWD
jgi:hypothetical protein